jgi:uncharacterized membrane protein
MYISKTERATGTPRAGGPDMLNTSLWIAQWLVAVTFALTGTLKVTFPREKLATRMRWAVEWPRGRIKLLGLAEVLGAVGLIAPQVTGIAPYLTPLAAVCLAVLMVGAARTHLRLGESPMPPVVVGVVCLCIAAGRLLMGTQA